MRWRDAGGVRWRVRQTRLAWRRRIKPEDAFDLAPGGDDPVALILSIPCVVVLAFLLPIWLVELFLRLILAPFVAGLRLTGFVPYYVELLRNGRVRGTYTPSGRYELVRLRRALAGRRGPGRHHGTRDTRTTRRDSRVQGGAAR